MEEAEQPEDIVSSTYENRDAKIHQKNAHREWQDSPKYTRQVGEWNCNESRQDEGGDQANDRCNKILDVQATSVVDHNAGGTCGQIGPNEKPQEDANKNAKKLWPQ